MFAVLFGVISLLYATVGQAGGTSAKPLESQPLRIGISSRSLFNLEEEHAVFVNEEVQAYATLQLNRETLLSRKGPDSKS